MGISNTISRFTSYYSRHGFGATIRRAQVVAKQALFSGRMVLFYCDLAKQHKLPANLPGLLTVQRLRSRADLSPVDLREMTSFWNPTQAHGNIQERFEQGASLWVIKSDEKLAGYGWTMRGHTIEPHYFPLAQDDVHLFDFHVFPQYRGRGLNPLLVNHILGKSSEEDGGRAFIEAAEWNKAQLSSLTKTPFQRLGYARKSTIFRRIIVCWDRTEAAQQARRDVEGRIEAARVVGSQEK
jgi:ribosomal protein S18 acetylase RimI-like enzyme